MRAGVGTPRLEQKKTPIWFKKTKGFQVNVIVGFLPGSITAISGASTDVWSLFA